MMSPYEIRFAQLLHARLTQDLQDAHTDLGSGSQIVRDDAAATGMACAKYMGLIDGFKTALVRIKQVNDELTGKTKRKDEAA
jgi:hypothetical protein